jgi:hypothetical protein
MNGPGDIFGGHVLSLIEVGVGTLMYATVVMLLTRISIVVSPVSECIRLFRTVGTMPRHSVFGRTRGRLVWALSGTETRDFGFFQHLS